MFGTARSVIDVRFDKSAAIEAAVEERMAENVDKSGYGERMSVMLRARMGEVKMRKYVKKAGVKWEIGSSNAILMGLVRVL